MLYTQAELIERLLKALDLWPPDGFETTHTPEQLRRSLNQDAKCLTLVQLQAVHWVVVILSLTNR